MIGEMLAHTPKDPDGIWPHQAVRNLLESIEEKSIEDGIASGVWNKRGVVVKHFDEGGKKEQELAELYVNYAKELETKWFRTATLLRKLVSDYRSFAGREDIRSEQDQSS